jgi:Flp pilus assembly protein TadD
MDDRAALLNNAGFAAGVRGDYAKAEQLLDEAMKARTQHYERAAENLKLVEALKGEAGIAAQ